MSNALCAWLVKYLQHVFAILCCLYMCIDKNYFLTNSSLTGQVGKGFSLFIVTVYNIYYIYLKLHLHCFYKREFLVELVQIYIVSTWELWLLIFDQRQSWGKKYFCCSSFYQPEGKSLNSLGLFPPSWLNESNFKTKSMRGLGLNCILVSLL